MRGHLFWKSGDFPVQKGQTVKHHMIQQTKQLPQLSARLTGLLVIVGAGLAILMLALPPIALVIRAIDVRAWEQMPQTGVLQAVWISIMTTSAAVFIIIALCMPLAYILAYWQFPFKRVLNLLVQLPIVLPPAVAGLALLITFGRRGLFGPALESAGISLPFTMAAVVMAQIFVSAPFFIRSAQIGFQNIPPEIEDAARVDGASGLTLFRHITLPLSLRAVAIGLTLSWTRALGEFGATIIFAGSLSGRTQTMPLLVYNMLERNVDAAIWTGIILIGIAVFTLGLLQLLVLETH